MTVLQVHVGVEREATLSWKWGRESDYRKYLVSPALIRLSE